MRNIKILFIVTLTFICSMNVYAGDAAAGKTAYATCGACHGMNGEGNKAMNAPKLAGQDIWYIVSSLKRFKSGARGTGDPIAAAMVPMAKMLNDTQIDDVSAYIATMK